MIQQGLGVGDGEGFLCHLVSRAGERRPTGALFTPPDSRVFGFCSEVSPVTVQKDHGSGEVNRNGDCQTSFAVVFSLYLLKMAFFLEGQLCICAL